MDRRRGYRLLHRLCAAGLPFLCWVGEASSVGAAPPEIQPAAEMQAAEVRQLSIGLDTVMRLVDEQNAPIARARAKVEEACAEAKLAAKKICPDPCEYHERKLKAEANVWQSRGELSRLTYETLLDATSTYIDLVAAKQAESIARSLHQELSDLVGQAEKLAEKVEPAVKVEVARIRTDMLGREQLIRRLQAQAEAAAAKLIYLLGLDPCVQLVPVDPRLVPIDLVDAQADACDLAGQALRQGPGIPEMEGLLALVEDAARRAQRSLLLSILPTGRLRQQQADAQRAQVQLAYQDLRGKLTAGVQEAKSAILAGAEEIRLTEGQVTHASDARNLSKKRRDNNVPGSSFSEVLLSLQALGLAHVNHISSIRDYDKAQLRLYFLMGGGQPGAAPIVPALTPDGERIAPPKFSEPDKP